MVLRSSVLFINSGDFATLAAHPREAVPLMFCFRRSGFSTGIRLPCKDASPAEKNLIAVTQGPILGAHLDEKVSVAA